MQDKKYLVPEGMLKAALAVPWSGRFTEDALLAAIHWLAENPIVPTPKQREALTLEYSNTSHALEGTSHQTAWLMMEWPRRMFLAPEPQVHPMLVMLVKECEEAGWEREKVATLKGVFESAYRRGREDGEKNGRV